MVIGRDGEKTTTVSIFIDMMHNAQPFEAFPFLFCSNLKKKKKPTDSLASECCGAFDTATMTLTYTNQSEKGATFVFA